MLGAALAEIAVNPHVKAAVAARFDFASGTRRIYRGSYGPITDVNGNIWQGIGDLGQISGIQVGAADSNETLKFELSGLSTDYYAAIEVNQKTELHGRECAVYLMMFNDDWSLASAPIAMRTAVMERMVRNIDAQNRVLSITLSAESFQVSRFRAPNGYLTHADQIARYPDDYILERISGYAGPGRVLYWN